MTRTRFVPSAATVLFVQEEGGAQRQATPDEVLHAALGHLAGRLRGTPIMSSPEVVREFLCLKLGALEHETFGVLMLDAQHRVIDYVELFRGSVSQTSVYPREVVKEALAMNAGSVVMVHNHPSGSTEPSRADELLTKTMVAALSLVDVRVLDHLIVAGAKVTSMAERGLV